MKLMTRMLCLAFCATCLPAVAATWYVSASGGSDTNSGTDWATAKASIQSAIDAAGSGDTIIVTNGTYLPIVTSNKYLTIRSVDGADVTVIDGLHERRCATLDVSDVSICTNTTLVGFTLRDGWAASATDADNGGAGCLRGGIARNCIITGGEGRGAGGAAGSILENCLICDNYAQYNGGGGDGCVFRNCTLVNNRANHNGAAYCNGVLENCIVYGNQGMSEEFQGRSLGWGNALIELWDWHRINVYTDDPKFVDMEAGDYRLAEDSPCIDAGLNEYAVGEIDLMGNQRVSNGVVDIGAYEYSVDPSAELVSVSFDGNFDGSTTSVRTYVVGSKYRSLPSLVRSGYILDGWYTQVSGGDKIERGSYVRQEVTALYAHWTEYSAAQRAALDMTTDSSLGDNGSSVWVVDASTYHTGNSSLKSAAIGDSQSTYQTLTVHGTGSVSFWWKVSSESNYDHLRYYVDGVEQAAISGEVDWQQKTVTFSTEGEHVIKWQYSKDGSVSRGSDCGWIDGVEINMTGEHLPVSGRDIVLDLNGSAETNWVCRVEDGQPFGALPTPEWIGHRFIGWFTQADGGDAVSEETVVDSSCLKLYARWTSVCTIAFDVGGVATGSVECIFREIGNAIGELPKSTMTQDTGFILLGWFTLPEGGKMVTEKTVVLSDMTLYAHWAMAGEVSIVSCGVRETDATILDVIYRVNSTNATANVRALAFENGEESFAKVVRPETFVDNTGRNLGYMVPANTNLTLSWKVTDDWDVKLARVKFMILVEENFYPLPLDLVTIPANGSHRAVTFSANEISSDVFRDALFWLYADHDEGLTLENGVLSAGGVILANGAELVPAAAARYVFKTMGYSLLDGAELEYVNETARLNLKSEGTEQHAFKQD